MVYVDIPNIFLVMKYILYSKLGYIHKKIKEFIHITCNAGPASLVLPRFFLVHVVLPLYLKVLQYYCLGLVFGRKIPNACSTLCYESIYRCKYYCQHTHDMYCWTPNWLTSPSSVVPI